MLEDNGFGKLGFYSNAILYLALGIGSIISTWVMRILGDPQTMGLGMLMCVTFMMSFIFPSLKQENSEKYSESFWFGEIFVYIELLFFSFVNGIGEALMWVAQGKYISECATVNNKGFFFGYFWAYYMATQIVGNYVAGLILGKVSQTAYILIMSALTFASALLFFFLKKPQPYHSNKSGRSSIKDQNPKNTSGLLDNDNQALLSSEQKDQQNQENHQNEIQIDKQDSQRENKTVLQQNVKPDILRDIKSVLNLTISKRMRLMLPLCFWTGISIAYYSGLLVCMLTDTMPDQPANIQYEKSMYAMVIFGVGEMIGCFFIGYVVDKKGSKFASVVDVVIIVIQTIVTLLFLWQNQFNYLALLMTFMWGFQDSATNTHLAEMLGFEFESNSEPFSVFNLVQAFGVFVFELLETYVDTHNSYVIYTWITGIIGIFSCAATFFFDFKEREGDKVLHHQLIPNIKEIQMANTNQQHFQIHSKEI
eukprot:403376714